MAFKTFFLKYHSPIPYKELCNKFKFEIYLNLKTFNANIYIKYKHLDR